MGKVPGMVFIELGQRPELVFAAEGRHPGPSFHEYCIDCHTLHLYTYEGELRVDGIGYPITFGSVGFNPPKAHTRYHYREALCAHLYVHFRASEEGGVAFPVMSGLGEHYADLRGTFETIIRLYAVNRLRAELRLWDLLLEIRDLVAARNPREPAAHLAVRKAMERIERGLHDPPPVALVAREVGLSHTHLNRLFKAACGKTLKAWAAARRMERARHLLLHTDFPVRQVARECGVVDLHQFNKLVRHYLGRSPRALRARGEGSGLE